jgi:hypothetical protein
MMTRVPGAGLGSGAGVVPAYVTSKSARHPLFAQMNESVYPQLEPWRHRP